MRKLPPPLPITATQLGQQTFGGARTSPPGGLYVFEHLLHDTVTYPAAGGAGLVLNAFGNTGRGADQTLSNWPVAGQLPKPHKFHGLRLFVTPLVQASSFVDAEISRLADIDRVLNIARGVVDFDITSTGRRRPPVVLRAIPSLPGVQSTAAAGTVAAQDAIAQYRQTGEGDGFPFDLPLDSGESFGIALRFGPAAVVINADLQLQIAVYGWYYQPAG